MKSTSAGLLLIACTSGGDPTDSVQGDSGADTATATTTTGVLPTAPVETSGPLTIEVLSPEPAVPVDECAMVCFSAAVTDAAGAPVSDADVIIEIEGGDFVSDGTPTGADGIAEVCPVPLPVGAGTAAFTARRDGHMARTTSDFDIRPFGYDLGLDKPTEDFESTAPPEFTPYAKNPVFTLGDKGDWDSKDVMLPALVQHTDGSLYMFYAGASEANYEVGAARSQDGLSWTRLAADPVLPASDVKGDWKRYATNSPAAVAFGDDMEVWYTGRQEETSELSIGVSTTSDGVTFSDHPANPLLTWTETHSSWEGAAVAHPAVIRRDGFIEVWYSTGLHHVGYAISADDGATFTKYCGGPVLSGDSYTWERGQVKSSEVIYTGSRYEMTYSAGGTGEFQVGWATSANGIHWERHSSPIVRTGEGGTWTGTGTLGAALLIESDRYRMWYSGVSGAGTQIGYAEAPR